MEIEDLYLLNEQILEQIQYINVYLQAANILLAMLFIQRWLMSLFKSRGGDSHE